MLFLLVLTTTISVRVFERMVDESYDNFWNVLWLVIITMSTVGYGEFHPVTAGGRAVIICSGIFGGLITIAMVTGVFLAKLDLTEDERRVEYAILRSWWNTESRSVAATCLQQWWLGIKEHEGQRAEGGSLLVFKPIKRYRRTYQKLQAIIQNKPLFHDVRLKDQMEAFGFSIQ